MTTTPHRNLDAKHWVGIIAILAIGVTAQHPDALPGVAIVFLIGSAAFLGFDALQKRASHKQFFITVVAISSIEAVVMAGMAVIATSTAATVVFSLVAALGVVSGIMFSVFAWFEP